MPTEFATLLDYQEIMSQLVLKETLAGVQQDLERSKARGQLVRVKGKVRQRRRVPVAGTSRGGVNTVRDIDIRW